MQETADVAATALEKIISAQHDLDALFLKLAKSARDGDGDAYTIRSFLNRASRDLLTPRTMIAEVSNMFLRYGVERTPSVQPDSTTVAAIQRGDADHERS